MPWKASSVMEEKLRFGCEYERPVANREYPSASTIPGGEQ